VTGLCPVQTGRSPASIELLHSGNCAILVKCSLQVGGDGCGIASLDLVTVHHVDHLALAQNCDRWRRRRISSEISAGTGRCLRILPCKYSCTLRGLSGVLQCQAYCGTHAAGRASADRIYDHHGGAGFVLHKTVDISGATQFFNSKARQFLAHRDHHYFWIHELS
jgi:hypothetical protein